jgi:hypothetical protein
MKGFRFKGVTFFPSRQLTAEEKRMSGSKSAWRNRRKQDTAGGVLADREAGWDYRAFCQAAREAGARKIDLFRVAGRDGQLFLPSVNELFLLPAQA